VPRSLTRAAASSGAAPDSSAPAIASDILRNVHSRETSAPISRRGACPDDPSSPTSAARSGYVDRKRSGPLRSNASSPVTCFQPAPTSPSTIPSGTCTRSNTTSLKWWAPVSSLIGRMVTPGASSSTMNCVSPAWRAVSSRGAERARAKNAWAWCAPDVQTLVPVSSQPSSTFSAFVRTLARSDPESGSLMPMPKYTSPRAIPGRNLRRCSSVP
jgi:hypothetical protein